MHSIPTPRNHSINPLITRYNIAATILSEINRAQQERLTTYRLAADLYLCGWSIAEEKHQVQYERSFAVTAGDVGIEQIQPENDWLFQGMRQWAMY